jgi:electron transfer flavoprotein alpha subunit
VALFKLQRGDEPIALTSRSMISVVLLRSGVAPDGAFEAIAESSGSYVAVECDGQAAALAVAVAPLVHAHDVVIVPGSPDGRDFAPHLARLLGRPLLAGAIAVRSDGATLARHGGRVLDDVFMREPFVATLEPGSRSADEVVLDVRSLAMAARTSTVVSTSVLPPDPATVDLTEAPRIIGGGAGLDGPERFDQLAALATALGASVGATRVITDRGWIGHERQIGTTGVTVDPDLYMAFGVSGAVQHIGGIGTPEHIISVNTDRHCPMMALADLAIVADANGVVEELVARLDRSRSDA